MNCLLLLYLYLLKKYVFSTHIHQNIFLSNFLIKHINSINTIISLQSKLTENNKL